MEPFLRGMQLSEEEAKGSRDVGPLRCLVGDVPLRLWVLTLYWMNATRVSCSSRGNNGRLATPGGHRDMLGHHK